MDLGFGWMPPWIPTFCMQGRSCGVVRLCLWVGKTKATCETRKKKLDCLATRPAAALGLPPAFPAGWMNKLSVCGEEGGFPRERLFPPSLQRFPLRVVLRWFGFLGAAFHSPGAFFLCPSHSRDPRWEAMVHHGNFADADI